MPNWCENQVRVEGLLEHVEAFVAHVQGAPESWGDETPEPVQVLCFNRIVPVPAEVVSQGYSSAGYHWCNRHWGTKWEPDIQHDVPAVSKQSDGTASADYLFNTAWSPPIPWLDAAAAQWPMLTFRLIHGEPGNDEYGEGLWEHGERTRYSRIDSSEHPAWIEEHFAWVLEMQED